MEKLVRQKIKAQKYAQAFCNIFKAEIASTKPDNIGEQIQKLNDWYKEHMLFFSLLHMSNVPHSSKEKMIDRVTSNLQLSEPLHKLLQVVLNYKDIGILPLIIKALIKKEKDIKNIENISVKKIGRAHV